MKPEQPVIYEINTWVWLVDLSAQAGKNVNLANVPDSIWDQLAELQLDYVWLMGVWQRSGASRKIARQHIGLQDELGKALPGLTTDDVVGSAYAIKDYVVADRLGGEAGLAQARAALRTRNIGLLLDYVPNHVAVDHRWVTEAPECLLTVAKKSGNCPSGTFKAGNHCVAHGRDPYFPPWTDTAQLNAFSTAMRLEAAQLMRRLATVCDGVRCDMAMLLLDDDFQRTWGKVAGEPLETEFWTDTMAAARAVDPDFKFMAEAYWEREHRLLELGFDWAYDKTFYDLLRDDDPQEIEQHLERTARFCHRLVKFTENHDEPRAAATFAAARVRSAAVTAALMPGPLLVHEGQLEGRRVRLPVQLGRRRDEPADMELAAFHRRLSDVRTHPAFRRGRHQILRCWGWPDNSSHKQLLAWLRETDEERFVIVVNMSDQPSQARIPLPWADLEGRNWLLEDRVNEQQYERFGEEMRRPGLYVELVPWGYHVFKICPVPD